VTEPTTPAAGVRFSDELEAWLRGDGPKTLGQLGRVFEDRGFAVTILVLMFVPALPLPTGGVTHLFELITIVLGAEMIAGRRTIWLPDRWLRRGLGATGTGRAIPFMIRGIRRAERISHGRGAWLFAFGLTRRVLGLLFVLLATAAALAPPFSGLDTVPAMAAIAIALSIVLEDVLVLLVGIVLGVIGVILIITLGAAAVHLVDRLI